VLQLNKYFKDVYLVFFVDFNGILMPIKLMVFNSADNLDR